MKTRVQLALVGSLLSVLAHIYLTTHYYAIKFGSAGGQSLCNLSAKFDCDAVAASSFSSLLGIPLSIWGGVTNAVLFVMILSAWLELSEHPERLRRWALALAGFSLSASVVMATIAITQLQNYCIVCIGLYFLSALVFFSYRGALREPFWMHIQRDFSTLASESKGIFAGLAIVPLGSFLAHHMFMQNFGEDAVGKIVNESVLEWESAPKNEFVAKPSLVMGAPKDKAKMTLVEFADFRCGHCKMASYSLDAFVKSHPDVRLEFYAFPLDGACNDKIESKSGISCRLAQAVVCAEKEANGWSLHHALFEAQDQVNQMMSTSDLDVLLSKTVATLGLNWTTFETCLQAPETADAIKSQAKQGGLVNVMGTPTIFANGKLLSRGQLIPVLEEAHRRAKSVN